MYLWKSIEDCHHPGLDWHWMVISFLFIYPHPMSCPEVLKTAIASLQGVIDTLNTQLGETAPAEETPETPKEVEPSTADGGEAPAPIV